MTFSGDLEHFPLVDIVQLLHTTNKTGTLSLNGPKGESQLVFRDGYFVSANHVDNSVRIGQILLEMGVVAVETLDSALAEQKNAGAGRKPLVATLIENGHVDKQAAFNGLEMLIEMTIVEVLTWTSGSFSLDVSTIEACDEYRYFPEMLQQEILLNAQGILMDALRIYDEKMRDGTLSEIFFRSPESAPGAAGSADLSGATPITADLLGLDALDDMVRTIPDVFIGLKDLDPSDEHRRVVSRAIPETAADLQDRLIGFLIGISRTAVHISGGPVTALLLLTADELFAHSVRTICRHANLFVLATDEEGTLDVIIEQTLARELHPVLLIDIPHDTDLQHALALARQKRETYPHATILLATCSSAWRSSGMQALAHGIQALLPRPCPDCHKQEYVPQLIEFLKQLSPFLKNISQSSETQAAHQVMDTFTKLKSCTEPPEIALALLNYASVRFERAITFVVAGQELIAEKSIGVSTPKSEGATPPLMFRLPLQTHSVFQDVIEKGRLYYGQRSDATLTTVLYREIEAPRSPKVMIVPLISRGKVIALIYADFGMKPVALLQPELIEAVAQYAGSRLDNALYRKNIEKTA
ncbi:MAG TPA: DUF4388 domain-containing protein [Desulfuromonadales bacterium]|nr:DUF4388 domain-containing protein [Desulfuromonadales bacterium]